MYTTLISEDVLFEEYDNPEWIIFDARYDLMDKNAGKDAYLQGHIPGAIYVDLHDDLSRPPSTNKGTSPITYSRNHKRIILRAGYSCQYAGDCL